MSSVAYTPERRSIFARIRSRSIMGVLSGIPTVICVLLLIGFTVMQIRSVMRSGDLIAQMALAERFGALIHTLQKERGASAGYLASGGASFGDALPGLRRDTDANAAALKTALDGFDIAMFDVAARGEIAAVLSGLDRLPAMRGRVDRQAVSVPDQVSFYSGVIRSQLRTLSKTAVAAGAAQSAIDLVSHTLVMEAKERMGVTRAVGASGFGRGAFTPAEIRRLLSLVAARDAFLLSFDAYTRGAARTALEQKRASPALTRFAEMIDYALETGPDAPVDRYDGPAFFAAATEVIDALHGIEKIAVDQATAQAVAARNTALLQTALVIAPLAALVCFSGFLTYRAAVSLNGSMAWITRRLSALAAGDIDTYIRPGHPNEIGEIADAMIRLCDVERAARAERAERAAADEARVEAERTANETRIAELRAGVGAANAALTALARGDLSARMDGVFEGEFAELQRGVDATVASLRDAVEGIRSSAAAIAGSAGDAAGGAQDMSGRAAAQAASLEEIAASMVSLAESVRGNADRATQAQAGAARARADADAGAQTAQQAVEAMRRTEEASARITEMVSVIEGFAFQTGLLAVNAAVEAARAGETGKGFAVVAQEVRSLADRSSAAARDVADIVGAANARATESVSLIEAAGETLTGIAGSIAQLAGAVDDITAACRSQAEEVESVTQATATLQTETEGAAALADDGAGVAQDLNKEVERLEASIRRFHGDGAAPARAAA